MMRKKILMTVIVGLLSLSGYAQTNTFPSSGNVGIGTINPSQRLSIVGDGGTGSVSLNPGGAYTSYNAELNTQADNEGMRLFFGGYKVLATGGYNTPEITKLYSDNVETMTLNSGNVGIGTISPSQRLSIVGNGGTGSVSLNPGGAYTSYNAELNTQADIEGMRLFFGGYKVLTTEGYNTPEITKLYSDNAETITLNSGNVGIGTATPSEKLSVIGSIRATGTGNSIITHELRLSDYNTGVFTDGINGNMTLSSYNGGSGNAFRFVTNGNNTNPHVSGATSLMEITKSGNVGIGTISPDSKLTVAGKIHSQEVKVTVDAGADFVFEDNYKLPSLAETESFIKANKHLPEIASADEMIKKGVELGEMNIKLLQKIEELTLHLIELNKRVQNQQKEINQLKSKP